jgi:hypothetical protein
VAVVDEVGGGGRGASGSGISRRHRTGMSSAGLIPAEQTRVRQGDGSTGLWDAKESFPAACWTLSSDRRCTRRRRSTCRPVGKKPLAFFANVAPYPNFISSYPYIGRRWQTMGGHPKKIGRGPKWVSCWSNNSYPSYLKKWLVDLLPIYG